MFDFANYLSADQDEPSDPVNLVFSGFASAARVAYLFQKLDPRWRRPRPLTFGAMYARIDDLARGELNLWKPPDAELVLGDVLSRLHIRIYECIVHDGVPLSGTDESGVWSIAGIHREDLRPMHWNVRRWHVIQDWMGPQQYVRALFESNDAVGGIYDEDLQSAGLYQEVRFGGVATHIVLL